MQSRYESKRDHSLRKPLEEIVSSSIDNVEQVKALVEEILTTLGEQNIIAYGEQPTINILTPHGRVLALLTERPYLTVREMSTFFGVTESNINKSISRLDAEELIKRRKHNGRYEYYVNFEKVRTHSDARRLYALIARALAE